MRIRFLSAAVAALVLGGAGTALAAPVTVDVRIEGLSSTIFEGPVTTDAKTLTKDGTGAHPCDGTNGGANPTPGPTMTGALDDAAVQHGFTWDGQWFSFGDFGINRIGPDTANSSQFWGYALNFQPSQVGGCQQQVHGGDHVLFAYDFFSKAHLLELTGPASAAPGQPITVHVVDGQTTPATPVAGATVAGATTNAAGDATVTLTTLGHNVLKADKADSVRSNALDVCVHSGNDGRCGTTAPPPPVVPTRSFPYAHIAGIAEQQRFPTGHGPRELHGTVDVSQVRAVKLRLTRRHNHRCYVYSNHAARFERVRCGANRPAFFSIGTDANWSYLLPAALGPGRYVLDVNAVDVSGRRDALARGRNRVVFFVGSGR
ncbi:MAG: surface cell-adhesion protein [Solirubrobacterales bacterium]|nr:surface cell-adhesion protein [Solirubrobacterales bacterium]